MDNHASYAKVGFAVVAGAAAVVAALVYLGCAGGRGGVVYAETYSDNPVSGLSVGSDVNMRGVKIGEVKDISFVGSEYPEAVGADIPKIHILMAVSVGKMRRREGEDPEDHLREAVAKGLHATVAASGITGLSKIELDFPRVEIPPQSISWNPRGVCIPPAPSMLESFSDAAAKFMNQVSRIDFSAAWTNIASVAGAAARIMENVDGLVADERENLASALRTIDEAVAAARDLAAELKDNPSLLLRQRDEEPLPETDRQSAPGT